MGRPKANGRRWIALAAITVLSPPIALGVGMIRLFRKTGWRIALAILSAAINGVFIVGLILVLVESPEDSLEQACCSDIQEVLPEGFVCRTPRALVFCEPESLSALSKVIPNTVYVAFNGIISVRFEFTDATFSFLREVVLSDKYGRAWIDVNLEDGALIYSRYTDDGQIDPDVSLMDSNGDGIPDRMVDWVSGQGFERLDDIVWHPLKKGD